MSKAILVMDMPNSCLECDFRRIENRGVWNGFSCCGITKRIIGCDISLKNRECPLRELPQKKDTKYSPTKNPYITEGYNACIDEILKGAEENG